MNFWFDITNSPHVLFFRPFFEELKKKGHNCIVTSRSHSQTIGLLKDYNIIYKEVDRHRGSNLISKSMGFFYRNKSLFRELKDKKIDVAISHQSPYCMKTAYDLGISKRVYIFDNDKAKLQNFLSFPYSTDVFCPQFLKNNFLKYPGIKEGIYLWDFEPNGSVKNNFNFQKKDFIVMRPDPWSAQYYKRKKELLGVWIERFKSKYDIILLPRNDEQKRYYNSKYGNDIILAHKTIDAPSLIYYSKLLIGAGGTMNREAVILGTPVVSLYDGKLLSVDKWLIDNKFLIHGITPDNFSLKQVINKKDKKHFINEGKVAFDRIMNYITNA